MDTPVIIAIVVVILLLYYFFIYDKLNREFDAAVTLAESSCLAAVKSQNESDFDSAISNLTLAKTAQSAALAQYSATDHAPERVNLISARLDAIHCGNRAAEKKAVDAIATATAANIAANKSGNPDDIQTAISTRDIAFRAIKEAITPYGSGTSYVTTVLNSTITAFKALTYNNETTDKTFVDSVKAAQDSCASALTSQSEADFTDAISKIATAKSNKIASFNQYADPNLPPVVRDAAAKLGLVNCGQHTLDKAAIDAVASAAASCATANLSKLPSDIQVALTLRAAAQKALGDATAQYATGSNYTTKALSSAIDMFNGLVYNNLINDKDFIDTVASLDSNCSAALKSNDSGAITSNINQITAAKTKQASVLAQYVGFTVPQAVADASIKLSKLPCPTRNLDSSFVSYATNAISFYNKAASTKVPGDLYTAMIYYYYTMYYSYTTLASYKANGFTTTSTVYDAAMKAFSDLKWDDLASYCIKAYPSLVDKLASNCDAARSSQSLTDLQNNTSDYNLATNLYYAIYYYNYGKNYPNYVSLPSEINTAYSKQYGVVCRNYSVDNTAINTIASAASACASGDAATAKKAYGIAANAVRAVVNTYGSSTTYAMTSLDASLKSFSSLSCSAASPFTFTGKFASTSYLYFYVNDQYYSYMSSGGTVSISNIVPGDIIKIYTYSSSNCGVIGTWNDSVGNVVNSSLSTLKLDTSSSPSGITLSELTIPSGITGFPSEAKYVGPSGNATYFRCMWTAV